MDLYGQKSKSIPQKAMILLLEVLILYAAYFILFKNGGKTVYNWFGINISEGDYVRRAVIFSFSLIVFVRMAVMMIFFLKRKVPFEEVFSVPFAFALYYIGFAIFAFGSPEPINAIDYFGIGIFLFGSYLNTFSELKRNKWKKRPENKGKLYTEGLFKYSMHINYFGDLLWVIGYTVLTHNVWSVWIPILLFLFFAFYNIPKLDSYLSEKYKDQFEDYKKRTKKFIPFIY